MKTKREGGMGFKDISSFNVTPRKKELNRHGGVKDICLHKPFLT